MPEMITVTELNTRVKDVFNKTPTLNDIWVSGEISNLKKYPSGYYFVLKDPSSEIHSVMFNSARSRIDFEPKENMKVAVFGSIAMYVPRGTYQFMVESMRQSGIGDRYIAFEKLKKKLDAEGLFDASRKRKIPQYPKTIGVVTSRSGAVIHDIITTSASRYTANILLAPAMVQGEGAAETIVAGIKLLNKADVDVIIVARGGGSIEDLWPFNEEIVARAIYESKAPVVSAVGHETDFTIADFVADLRVPTPTGAAASILRDKSELRMQMDSYSTRLNRAMFSAIESSRHSFKMLDAKLDPSNAMNAVGMCSMHLDKLSKDMDFYFKDKVRVMRSSFDVLDARLQPKNALDDICGLRDRIDNDIAVIQAQSRSKCERYRVQLDSFTERPEISINNSIKGMEDSLASHSKHLEGLNPLNILSRGYSMITSEDGTVITSIERLDVGDSVKIRFRDGSASADIKDKEMEQ